MVVRKKFGFAKYSDLNLNTVVVCVVLGRSANLPELYFPFNKRSDQCPPVRVVAKFCI